MSTTSFFSDAQVLHSWKEISAYTGRGVRTLQRYEANLGFPIHRALGKPRSSVMAFKHEIDRWLERTPMAVLAVQDAFEIPPSVAGMRGVDGSIAHLWQSTERCRTKTDSMQQGFASIQQAVGSMQQKMNSMLLSLERTQGLVTKTKTLWEQTQLRRQRMLARVKVIRSGELSASATAS